MVLAVALFTLGTLSAVLASALLMGSAEIRAARNYRGATQVHFVAESAISEALQTINGPGVVNFENDIVTPWSASDNASVRHFAALNGYQYAVVPVADADDPANVGRLIATAGGPEGVRNVVVANIVRSNFPGTSCGAIYLASDAPTDATFHGNAFLIDGNDHNYTGGPGPGPAVPGIGTRNARNTQEAIDSLNGEQGDNVQGYGFSNGPPVVPSVMTCPTSPSAEQMERFIEDFLSRPGVVEWDSRQINGNEVFGTPEAPQITHFTDTVLIRGNGTATGAGIMIVDGDLIIQGTLDFKGLILVRGRTSVERDPETETEITGNVTVYGSLWTNDLNMVVGGSAIMNYSSQALSLANQAGGGGALPAPLLVTSLADCSQLPGGRGGCP